MLHGFENEIYITSMSSTASHYYVCTCIRIFCASPFGKVTKKQQQQIWLARRFSLNQSLDNYRFHGFRIGGRSPGITKNRTH